MEEPPSSIPDPGEHAAARIRRAVPDSDRDAWLALRGALWPECSRDDHLAEMAEIAADPARSVALLAESDDGEPVGLAEAAVRPWAEGAQDVPVVHLEGWFVAARWRRRGVGRALVQEVEAWGREHGAREFTSDTEVDNATSQAAHRALGFEETSRVVNYRRPLRGAGFSDRSAQSPPPGLPRQPSDQS